MEKMANLQMKDENIMEYNVKFWGLQLASEVTEVEILQKLYLDKLSPSLYYKILKVDPGTLTTFEKIYSTVERFNTSYKASQFQWIFNYL